eukprot:3237287-Pyramimonas_sp.AAC.2
MSDEIASHLMVDFFASRSWTVPSLTKSGRNFSSAAPKTRTTSCAAVSQPQSVSRTVRRPVRRTRQRLIVASVVGAPGEGLLARPVGDKPITGLQSAALWVSELAG